VHRRGGDVEAFQLPRELVRAVLGADEDEGEATLAVELLDEAVELSLGCDGDEGVFDLALLLLDRRLGAEVRGVDRVRAGEVGDAFTFVAPDEQNDLRAIEKAIGKRLPQITIPDFDYNARPEGRLEIPIGERIAAIRGRKADERARSRAKADRQSGTPRGHGSGSSQDTRKPSSRNGSSRNSASRQRRRGR